MDLEIKHDKEEGKFETTIDNEKAYLNYRKKSPDTLEYYETFVPENHRRENVASRLAEQALVYAKKNNMNVIPTCSFVDGFIEKNQEFKAISVKK